MMRQTFIFIVLSLLSVVNGKNKNVKLEHSISYDEDVFGARDDVPKAYIQQKHPTHLQLNDANHEKDYENAAYHRYTNNRILSSYIPGLTQEIFKDVNDGKHDLTRADIPVHPDEQYVIPDVDLQNPEEGLSSVERVFGYFKPPRNGDYIFKISSEGESTFSMSTSDDNNGLQKYADVLSGQFVPRKQYDKFLNQKSETIPMQAGKMYYLEVIHKRTDGPSHLQLGAVFPDGTKHYPLESKYFFSAKEGKDELKFNQEKEDHEETSPMTSSTQKNEIKVAEETRKEADVRNLDKLDNKLAPLKCGPKVRLYSTNFKCAKRNGHVCKHGISADDSILKLNTRDTATLFTILKPSLNNYADSVSFQVNGKHGFYLLKDGEKFIVAPNDGSKEFASLSSFGIENGDEFQPSSYLLKLFNTKDDYVCHSKGSSEILTNKRSENCAFYIVPDELDMNGFEPSCKDVCEKSKIDDSNNQAPNLEALPDVLNDLAHHAPGIAKSNEKASVDVLKTSDEKSSNDVLKVLGEKAVSMEAENLKVDKQHEKLNDDHSHIIPEEIHAPDDIKTRLNVERIDPSRVPQEEDRYKELLSLNNMKNRLLSRIDAEKNENEMESTPTVMMTNGEQGGEELKTNLLNRLQKEKAHEMVLHKAKLELTALKPTVTIHAAQEKQNPPATENSSHEDMVNSSPAGISEPSNVLMPISATKPNIFNNEEPYREKLLERIKEEKEKNEKEKLAIDIAPGGTATQEHQSNDESHGSNDQPGSHSKQTPSIDSQDSSSPSSSSSSLSSSPSSSSPPSSSSSSSSTAAASASAQSTTSSSEKSSNKEENSEKLKQPAMPTQEELVKELERQEKAKKAKSSNQQFITVHFQNEVGASGVVRIISSIKPEGYLLGSDIFKLKLVFKYKYVKSVKFRGIDESGQNRNVLLNGEASIKLQPKDNQKDYDTIVVTIANQGESNNNGENKELTKMDKKEETNDDRSLNNNPKFDVSAKVISGVARNKLPQINTEIDHVTNKDTSSKGDDLILDNHGPMENLYKSRDSKHGLDDTNDVPDVVEIAYDDDNAQKKTITEIHVGKDFIEQENTTLNSTVNEIIQNVTGSTLDSEKNEKDLAKTQQHRKNDTSPSKVSGEPNKVSGEPNKASVEPNKISGEPNKASGEPKKVSGDEQNAHESHSQEIKKESARNLTKLSPDATPSLNNSSTIVQPTNRTNITQNDSQDVKLFEKLTESGKHVKDHKKTEPVSLEKIQAEISKLDEASAALQASNLSQYPNHDSNEYTGGKPQKKTVTSREKLQSPVVEERDDTVVEKKNIMNTIHTLEENSYRAKQKSLDNFLREYTNEDENQKERYRVWVARHQHPREWYQALPVTGVKRSPIRSFFYQSFSPTDPVVVHEEDSYTNPYDISRITYQPFHDDKRKRAHIPHQHKHKRRLRRHIKDIHETSMGSGVHARIPHQNTRIRRHTCQCDAICADQLDQDECMFDCENMCGGISKAGKKHKVKPGTRRDLKNTIKQKNIKQETSNSKERRSLAYQYGQFYRPIPSTTYNQMARSYIPRFYWKIVYPTEPQYQLYRRWYQPTKWYQPVANERSQRYYINQRPTTTSYYMPAYKKTAPLFYARNGVPSSPEDVKGKTPGSKKTTVPKTHHHRIVTPVKLIPDDEPVKKKSIESHPHRNEETMKVQQKNNINHVHKFTKTVTANRRTFTPVKTNVYTWHPVGFTRYAKIYQHSMPVVFKRNITMNQPSSNTEDVHHEKINTAQSVGNHTDKPATNTTQKLNKYKAALIALMSKSGVHQDEHQTSTLNANHTVEDQAHDNPIVNQLNNETVKNTDQKNNTLKSASKEQMAELQETFAQLNPDNNTSSIETESKNQFHMNEDSTKNQEGNSKNKENTASEIQTESKNQLNEDSKNKENTAEKSRIVNKIMNDDHKDGKRNNSYFAIEIADDENMDLNPKQEEEKNGVARTKTSPMEKAKIEIEREEELEKEKERESAHQSINNILFDNDVSSVFYSDIKNLHHHLKNSSSTTLLKEQEHSQSALGKGFVNHTASTSNSAFPDVSETEKEKELSKNGVNITPTKPVVIKPTEKANQTSPSDHEENKVLNEGDSETTTALFNKPAEAAKPTEMHSVDNPTKINFAEQHERAPTLKSFAQKPSDDHDLPTGKRVKKPTQKSKQGLQNKETSPLDNPHSKNSSKLLPNVAMQKFTNKSLNIRDNSNHTKNESVKILSEDSSVSDKLQTPKEIEAVYTDRVNDATVFPKLEQTNDDDQLFRPYNNHDTVNGDWFDTGFHPDSRTKQDIKMSKSGFLNKLLIKQKLKLEKEKLHKAFPTAKILENKIKNIVKAAELTENSELQNLITDSIGTALNEEQQSNSLTIKNAFHNISDLAQQDVESDNSLVTPQKGDNSEIAKIMSDYNDELSLQERDPQTLGDADTKADIMHQMSLHDQQEINALKSDLAGSINEKVKSQMMTNFSGDNGFEDYAEKRRIGNPLHKGAANTRYFINADITSLNKAGKSLLADQVSDAITETSNPVFPTAKENYRKHRLAKNKESKEFEGIKAKWKKVKEQNKHIVEEQKEKLNEEEENDQVSHNTDKEEKVSPKKGNTQNMLNSYFTEVKSKKKLSSKGRDMNDRQVKRQRKIKETLAMINDIENQIDGMIHSSDHQETNTHGLKAHTKGKTAVYKELVGSGDDVGTEESIHNDEKIEPNSHVRHNVEEEEEEGETRHVGKTNRVKGLHSGSHHEKQQQHEEEKQELEEERERQQKEIDKEELEDNDDKSETTDDKPTNDDYIENAEEEVEDQTPEKLRHKHFHHQYRHHRPKKIHDDQTIASVIESSDKRVRQQQANEMLNLQNEEVNDDLLKLKEVTQDGLQSMFAKAVAKQQKFMDEIQGDPTPQEDDERDDVIARDQLNPSQYSPEKLESYLGDQTIPYSNSENVLHDIPPNEIENSPSPEFSNDDDIPSNRKSDVEREDFDEDSLDNDNDTPEESDFDEEDEDDKRRRRRTLYHDNFFT